MKELYLFIMEKQDKAENLRPYTLVGYLEVGNNLVEKAKEEDSVQGYIIKFEEKQLKEFDKLYDQGYVRREVIEENEYKTVYAYQKNIDYMTEINIRKDNNNGKNIDMYLMIPCDLSHYTVQEQKNIVGEYLIEQIEKNNNLEFKSSFIKCLDRHVIGTRTMQIIEGGKEYYETGIVSITRHPKTNNGIVTIFLPLILNNPNIILAHFVSGLLKIETEQGKYIYLTEYLTQNNILISGTPKSLIFVEGTMSTQEKINILACESNPYGKIIGNKLEEMATTNIAQYNTAEVYCGECVLLELQKEFLQDYKERIANEAIEVFFMELLLLQDAAISRMCNRIIQELEIETQNPIRENNIQVLEELSCETAQAVLFLDFNCFIFPTVRNATETIAENFGLNKLIERYNKYKKILETIINIHMNRMEEMENNNLNMLLLILTITQVVPIFVQLFSCILQDRFSADIILSCISSIAVCIFLLLIYYLLKKRELKKYKNDVVRKNKVKF